MTDILGFVKKIYGIRSQIVHGSTLGEGTRDWLIESSDQIELLMRQILIAAVTELPPDDQDRRKALSGLYDLTDEDRSALAVEKFKEIRSPQIRKSAAVKIRELAGDC